MSLVYGHAGLAPEVVCMAVDGGGKSTSGDATETVFNDIEYPANGKRTQSKPNSELPATAAAETTHQTLVISSPYLL